MIFEARDVDSGLFVFIMAYYQFAQNYANLDKLVLYAEVRILQIRFKILYFNPLPQFENNYFAKQGAIFGVNN